MRLRRLLLALVGLALLPLLASPASAQYRRAPRRPAYRHGYELNPYLTFNDFETKTDLDDDVGVGFRFGYLYTPHHEVEFLIDGVSTDGLIRDQFGVVVATSNVDLTDVQVAYTLNFTEKDVVPYVTAGLGFLHSDDDVLGTETDGVFALGGGLRFFLGRAVYARIELRRNFFEGGGEVFAKDENFRNTVYAFGVGWRFGAP